ncbi:DUF262 domain-containing protein [Mesorhizobium sp.]|uniref:DUF262 domain-containing protein n=1 Tax=Mesorhizobium sp. TaxID=1871066 RepID=UPI000FE78998|nr:DUF262 domain-containing protein [Mesorhizobium sp.]RWE64077.1 MAG: DUF262 domain-containing protein [Mesorhizobium sp.]TIV24785.1 MAG: DUF262 domain-containing protein [Mesorhizobium sp.]
MKDFDTRTYNVSDFVEWNSRDQIQLSPDFQRRSVWSLQAKSYLVDTIIRGKPMPKMLLTQDVTDRRNVRVVVDGQQRLRAILEYVDGDYAVSRAHNKEFAGQRFHSLPPEVQSAFLKYEIGVDLLYDLPYREILDIFARLNTYTVKLNTQELLNAKYVGFFKQLAYRLGYRYVDYLIAAKVVTKAQVTRMLEAELTSDLLVSLIDGVQTNKNLESQYRKFEEDFDNMDAIEDRFDKIMSFINSIYKPEELAITNWSRIHLFYTLFTSIAHGLFKISALDEKIRPKITAQNVGKIRVILDDISARYDLYTSADYKDTEIPVEFSEFIDRSRRATTDTGSRIARSNFVAKALLAVN